MAGLTQTWVFLEGATIWVDTTDDGPGGPADENEIFIFEDSVRELVASRGGSMNNAMDISVGGHSKPGIAGIENNSALPNVAQDYLAAEAKVSDADDDNLHASDIVNSSLDENHRQKAEKQLNVNSFFCTSPPTKYLGEEAGTTLVPAGDSQGDVPDAMILSNFTFDLPPRSIRCGSRKMRSPQIPI